MRMSAAQVVLALALSPLLVETFTFPGDWHKIRQMMEARRDLQQLVGGATAVFIIISFTIAFSLYCAQLTIKI